MAELAIFGAVAAGIQLAPLALKILATAHDRSGRKTSKSKIERWIQQSEAFNLFANHFQHDLYGISPIAMPFIHVHREDASRLAVLLRQLKIGALSPSLSMKSRVLARMHKQEIQDIISNMQSITML